MSFSVLRHPFDRLPQSRRGPLFYLLLASSLLLMAVLNVLGAPLITPAAPQGIVSFELAGTPARAAEILASWDADASLSAAAQLRAAARLRAAFTLGLDYLFMPLYSSAVALACLLSGAALRRRAWPLAGLAAPLAYAQWLAAFLDAVENVGLTALLFGSTASIWPGLSALCAYGKFGLLFIGLVYSFLGLTSRLAARPLAVSS